MLAISRSRLVIACIAVLLACVDTGGSHVASVELAPRHLVLAKGSKLRVVATATLDDGTHREVTYGVLWSSSNTRVAVVDDLGGVAAVGPGNATISAMLRGGWSATVKVDVVEVVPAVLEFELTPQADTVAKGDTVRLVARAAFADGSAADVSEEVIWNSSAEGVARVDSAGRVQARSQGEATIFAKYRHGQTAAALIRVGPPRLKTIEIEPSDARVLLGDVERLHAYGVWSDGSKMTLEGATWAASGAVGVDASGTVTPIVLGTGIVTASLDGFSGSAPVQVVDGFSIVLLPDTQYETAGVLGGTPEMLFAQMDWIAAHRVEANIRAVIGLGDIVNCGGLYPVEWDTASRAYGVLDQAGIPYVPVIGNHDYDVPCGKVGDRSTSLFDSKFGPNRFASRSWYGSSFPAGSNANFYVTFEVGRLKFMIVALEFMPRNVALDWARGVIAAHPDRFAIIATHDYLVCGSRPPQRSSVEMYGSPAPFLLSDPTYNGGEETWEKLVSELPNIFLVVSGHFNNVPAHRVDKGVAGNLVTQMCVDFQQDGNGGSGLIRRLYIRPFQFVMEASTFSPYFDRYLHDDENVFASSYFAVGDPVEGVSGVPSPPTNVEVRGSEPGAPPRVDVSWTRTSSSEARFVLERATDAGFGSPDRIEIPAGASAYRDELVVPGTRYFYRLAAANAAGASAWAPIPKHPVSATIPRPRATTLALIADRQSPQPAGTAVTFTASAEGSSDYQFEYWMKRAGEEYALVRGWSSSPEWPMPLDTRAGAYRVVVYVRTNETVPLDLQTGMDFTLKPISSP